MDGYFVDSKAAINLHMAARTKFSTTGLHIEDMWILAHFSYRVVALQRYCFSFRL